MKEQLIAEVQQQMLPYLNNEQLHKLAVAMDFCLHGMEIVVTDRPQEQKKPDAVSAFIAAKRIEGCSEKTLLYYQKNNRGYDNGDWQAGTANYDGRYSSIFDCVPDATQIQQSNH